MSPPRQRTSSRVRSTEELYALDVRAAPRLGFVHYQLGLARLAVALQVPRAARAALLVLTASDFPADSETAGAYLTALRDPGLSAANIIKAFEALSELALAVGDPLAVHPSAG